MGLEGHWEDGSLAPGRLRGPGRGAPRSLAPPLRLYSPPLPRREGSPFWRKPGLGLPSSSPLGAPRSPACGGPKPGLCGAGRASPGSSLLSGRVGLALGSRSDGPVSLADSLPPSLSESVSEPRRRRRLGMTSQSELSLRVSLSSRLRKAAAPPTVGRSERERGSRYMNSARLRPRPPRFRPLYVPRGGGGGELSGRRLDVSELLMGGRRLLGLGGVPLGLALSSALCLLVLGSGSFSCLCGPSAGGGGALLLAAAAWGKRSPWGLSSAGSPASCGSRAGAPGDGPSNRGSSSLREWLEPWENLLWSIAWPSASTSSPLGRPGSSRSKAEPTRARSRGPDGSSGPWGKADGGSAGSGKKLLV
ncbi:hypothetical protein EYF80_050056 [Liparis tanakae]|uniref:Uncharacterized protein n=1 Tax=Liparis tanakae TaxID=230148 RepID=A0A4Z2FEY5_9TELE|nr:hypothetical protein EYF80_050056 [Liparis tanakae]